MRTILIAAILATAAAAPAHAEGFRAELHTGWDRVTGGGDHDDGVLYGAAFGYDIAAGNKLVLGIEAGIDDSTVKECGAESATVHACSRLGRDLSLVGRIGYKVSERGMVYALAGYTNVRASGTVKATTATTPTPTPTLATTTTTSHFSDTLDGVRLGLGYEHSFGERVYAKAEYRYSNYEAGGARHQLLTGVGFRF